MVRPRTDPSAIDYGSPTPTSLLENACFAACWHAAYKISSEIDINCRPGALTGLLFQRAPAAPLTPPATKARTRQSNCASLCSLDMAKRK